MKNGERRRVVVTGLGMITPLGSTVEKTWNGVVAGKSGIGPITRFDATGLETRIAGEVRDFDPLDYMERKEIRRSDRFVHFAVAAAGQALRSARLEITPELAPRIGVAFGSGIGGVETLVEQVLVHDKDPRKVSPFLIPMMIIDMAAGEIAMKYRAKGPNMGHVSACPRRMISAASPTAFALEAHAETWPMFGPLARYFMAISPAAMSMIIIGMRNGETLRGSFSWTSTCSTRVSTPPMPDPNATPMRGASSGVTSRRADLRAWPAAATAKCTKRSERRISLRSM